jgi:dephospho-CoA kinase
VFRVAVMGGIGSGKTAVTDYLAQRGAVIVDADLVAREVVEAGKPAWQQLRDAFGDCVLREDRTLDRGFVAEIVFHDATALRRLNQITHGAIGLEMARQIEAATDAELVAVALPLYRPIHKELFRLNEVWCVWVEPEVALARLTGPRGLSPSDAQARLDAQDTNDERMALADVVLHNSGTLDQLHGVIDAVLVERGLLSE